MTPSSVLIVEDEAIVAEDLQQTLLAFGYDAYAIAMSSDEAMAHATLRCPDVVLMDIRIKGQRDGIDTARLIRDKFHVPVVFLTAHADDTIIQRAKTTEPYGYLTKPVRAGELRSAIEIALYRSEIERRLRERERWFSTTLQSIADAVVTVDLAGMITFFNPEAELLTGLTSSEVLGKPARDVLRLMADRQPIDSPLERAISERRSVVMTDTGLVHAQTGATRSISESAAPVIDDDRVLGAVMVFRDITEQKQVQQQLELADRLASLGTMAAGVAHEINNPLAVVVSNASFVDEDVAAIRADLDASNALSPAIAKRLADIHASLTDVGSAASRIRKIVADLQTFSRPEPSAAGRADVVKALQWAQRTTATEVRYRATVTTAFHPVPLVRADETRLGQVFVNLIVNAAQAIEPGHPAANSIQLETRLDATGRVVVEVRDTGTGISPDIRDRIFDPFFTTKPVGVGTGLGLSISRGIVSAYGGAIEIESAPGAGTTVRVTLPASEDEEPKPAAIEAKSVERGRILVIDDEPIVLRTLQRILRDHDVTCVTEARAGLALLERGETFDMILSDLMMPGMDGVDFFEKVLELSPDVAKRIVFMTGGALTAKSEVFLQTVSNMWIEKPFSNASLAAVIERHLSRTRSS